MGGVASCAILALSEESIGGKMPDKKAHACFWTRHCPLTCIPTFLLEKKNHIKIYNNEIENGSEIIRSIMHQLFLWILHFNSVGRLVLGAIPKATIYITGIELMKWPLKGWEGGKKKKVGDHVKNGACVGLLAGWIIDRHILDAHNASFAPSPTYSTHRNDGTHSQRTR